MQTKVVVVFPYSGYKKGSDRERLFWQVVERCRQLVDTRPLVVINADTDRRKGADAFSRDKRSKSVEAIRVWAVDTCQMWLAGWGYALDKCKGIRRIIQLPGDIDWVDDTPQFLRRLDSFVGFGDKFNLVIGDFESKGRFNSKDLIDYYGTYALMANWFPDVTGHILQMPLNRPRSEFLNIDVKTLRYLLESRKFAYEQTLNMLIRLWDTKTNSWHRGIGVHSLALGAIGDEVSSRQYKDCLDQIERTERMLKMLWREINVPDGSQRSVQETWERYHELDYRSTSVRQNARIIIGNLLKVGT